MPDPVINVYSAEELRDRLHDELARNPFLGSPPAEGPASEEPDPDAPREPRQ